MQGKGKLTGISGHFAGNVFSLQEGKELTLGRSAKTSDVVFGDDDLSISRTHCTITYEGKSGCYTVTDHSRGGTYSSENTRFPKEQKVRISPGTLIMFGKTCAEIFRVG